MVFKHLSLILILIFFNTTFSLSFFKLFEDSYLKYEIIETVNETFNSPIIINSFNESNKKFPHYFNCTFNAFNQSFNLRFQHSIEDSVYILTKNKSIFHQTYRLDHCYLKGFGSLFYNSNNNVSSQKYGIVFRLIINKSVIYDIQPNSFDSYIAQKVHFNLTQINLIKSRFKRENKKLNLTLNAVLHADYTIFKKYQKLLNTSDQHYVEIFINVLYSHLIVCVNNIYKAFNSSFFTLSIRLIDMIVDKKLDEFIFKNRSLANDTINEQLINFNMTAYLIDANAYARNVYIKKYQNRNVGAYIVVTNFNLGELYGLAYYQMVCNSMYLTSVNRETYFYELIGVVAHEIGHTLGMDHDKHNEIYLMYKYKTNTPNSLEFSSESINSTLYTLLNGSFKIQEKYRCLVNANKEQNNGTIFQDEILPGHIYSLAEQCQMITGKINAFACSHHVPDICLEMTCQIPGNSCIKIQHQGALGI